MESLLDDSVGTSLLNIVCEERPESIFQPKKKRKNNKYERRRAKARKAKEQAIIGSSETQQRESNTPEEMEKQEAGEKGAAEVVGVSVAPSDDDHHHDEPKDINKHPYSEAISTAADNHGDSLIISKAPSVSVQQQQEQSVRSASPRPSSRRIHVDPMGDSTEARAKYLAEFHARPAEMDRKSRAVSNFETSKDSQHLFEGDGGESFESLRLHSRLVTAVESPKLGSLSRPTHIQRKAIQTLLQPSESNLFIQSETGSGKTLAYLLPIVQSLAVDRQSGAIFQSDRTSAGTRCIIVCPTRELASQTAHTATKLCQQSFSHVVVGCLSGGEKRKSEKARIRKGLNVLIATPGRLLDHIQKTESLLMALKGKLEWLVLDEADRLLDMHSQLQQIVQHLRANQSKSGPKCDGVTWRSVLVSATVTSQVQELAKSMLGGDTWQWARGTNRIDGDQSKIESESARDGSSSSAKEALDSLQDSTPRQLGQFHMTVTAKLRLPALIAFLVQRIEKKERTVVFMSTCDGVDFFHSLFSAMDTVLPQDEGKDAAATGLFGASCKLYRLHGNVPHAERLSILDRFNRSGSSKQASILLATDVAARGLNLTGVDWTVQYDPPCEVADYAHRAGRTARGGKSGHSLLFLLPSERPFLDVLKAKGVDTLTALSLTSTLNNAADVCADLTEDGEKRVGGGQSKGGSRSGESFSFELQRRLEECVLEDDARAKASFKDDFAESSQRKKKRVKKEKPVGRLLHLARQAYTSYIRSYSTKEKVVKHIFLTRALHLGHMARSFALKEPPSSFGSKVRPDADDKIQGSFSSLAFETYTDNQIAASVMSSRKRSRADQKKSARIVVDPKKARALLLANAASLERGGMDAF